MTWALRAGTIYTPDRTIRDGLLVVEGSRIAQVRPWQDADLPSSVRVRDLRPYSVAAGFIDLHIHGAAGHDFMDAEDDGCAAICAWHAAGGTTSLLATTASAPLPRLHRVLAAVRRWQRRTTPGARVLGAHVEGPFFDLQMRGCHLPEHVRCPEPADVTGLLRYADAMRSITLAPEIAGALPATGRLAHAGVVVAAAHSNADSSQVYAGLRRGLSHVTHLYNAMSCYLVRGVRRVSGLAETALARDSLTVEVIADGRHVSPERLTLTVRAKGASRVCLVTDAMRGAGMPDGLYTFGPRDGKAVVVKDGVALMPEGTGFASSTVTMMQCVAGMAKLSGVSLAEALAMASANPARVLGIENRKGSLKPGMDADLVVFDKALRVRETMVEGKVVYRAAKPRR